MNIGSIMWHSHLPLLSKAARQLDFAEITLFAARELEDDPLRCDTALNLLAAQDLILLYRSSESFWDRIEEQLKEIGKKFRSSVWDTIHHSGHFRLSLPRS